MIVSQFMNSKTTHEFNTREIAIKHVGNKILNMMGECRSNNVRIYGKPTCK